MGVVESIRKPWNSTFEENNLEVRTRILQDIGSNLETEAKARSDRLPSTSENVQKNPKVMVESAGNYNVTVNGCNASAFIGQLKIHS